MKKFHFKNKLKLVLVSSLLMLVFLLPPVARVSAAIDFVVGDVVKVVKDVKDRLGKKITAVAAKNHLKTFLGRMAERTAVFIAEDGVDGMSRIFSWDDVKDVFGATAVDLSDDLSMAVFGKSVCSPGLDFALNLNLGVKDMVLAEAGKLTYAACSRLCDRSRWGNIDRANADTVRENKLKRENYQHPEKLLKVFDNLTMQVGDRFSENVRSSFEIDLNDLVSELIDASDIPIGTKRAYVYWFQQKLKISEAENSLVSWPENCQAVSKDADNLPKNKLTEKELAKEVDACWEAIFASKESAHQILGINSVSWKLAEQTNLLSELKKKFYSISELEKKFYDKRPTWQSTRIDFAVQSLRHHQSRWDLLNRLLTDDHRKIFKNYLIGKPFSSGSLVFWSYLVETYKQKINKVSITLGEALDLKNEEQSCIERCFRGQVSQGACSWDALKDNLDRASRQSVYSVEGVDIGKLRTAESKERGRLLRDQFLGGDSSKLSMYTKLLGEAHRREVKNQEALRFQGMVKNDLKPTKTRVSGETTVPKEMIAATHNQPYKDSTTVETTFTGELIADTIGVFATTLVSKLINKQAQKKDTPLALGKSGNSTGGRSGVGLSSIIATRSRVKFRSRFAMPAVEANKYDLLEKFYTCNDGSLIDNYLNCTIQTEGVFREALRTRLTVAELLDQVKLSKGNRWGEAIFGSSPFLELSRLDNLKKLRWARVIPIGWEIAWQKNEALEEDKQRTFRQIVDCFEENEADSASVDDFKMVTDCNGDGEVNNGSGAGDNNPFYHLVDPDWLLMLPDHLLVREGVTALWDEASKQRLKGPVDVQSCLFEGGDGRCRSWGYCVREKNIWQFSGGEVCPQVANTCTAYQAVVKGPLAKVVSETKFNYLASSFEARDATECQPEGVYTDSRIAGCRQYYPKISENQWQVPTGEPEDLGFYFNSEVQSCQAKDQGCTEVLTFKGVDGLGAESFLTETQVMAIKGEEVGLSEVSEPKTPLDLYKQKAKQWLKGKDLISPFNSPYQEVFVESVSILAPQAAANCKLADVTSGVTSEHNLPGPAGCQVFTPRRAEEKEVTAKLELESKVQGQTTLLKPTACPLSCDGLGGYGVLATKIEQVLSPGQFSAEREYLIPHASEQCSASAAGCEEFTVVKRSGAATRLVDNYYLTDFQRCLASNQADQSAKYTSFQTESGGGLGASSWQLLVSDSKNSAPCTKPSYDAQGEVSCDLEAEKNVEDCQLGLAGCRQYTSADGKNYWRFENQVVPVTDNCILLKRSATGLPYRVNLNTAGRCQAAEKSCRAYISPEFGNFTELLQQKGCLDVNKNNLGACFAGDTSNFSGWQQSQVADKSLVIKTDSSSFTKAAGDFDDPTGFVSLSAKDVLSYQFSADKRASLSSGGSYRLLLEVSGLTSALRSTKLTAKLTALGQRELLVETEPVLNSKNVQVVELVFAELDFIPQSLELEFDQAVKIDNIRLQQIAAGSLVYLTKDSIEQGRSSCLAEVNTKIDNKFKWGTVTDLESADQCLAYDEIKVGVKKDTWPQVCFEGEGGCQSVVLTELTTETTADPTKGVKADSQLTLKPDPDLYGCSDDDARGCLAWGLPTKKDLNLPKDNDLVEEVYLVKDPKSWNSYSCRYENPNEENPADKYDGCLYYNPGQFLLKDPQYLGTVYQYQFDQAGQVSTWEKKSPINDSATQPGLCIVGDPSQIGQSCKDSVDCQSPRAGYPKSDFDGPGYCLTGVGQCQSEAVGCQQVQVRSAEISEPSLLVDYFLVDSLEGCSFGEKEAVGLQWQCLPTTTGWGDQWAKDSGGSELNNYKIRRGRECGQWLMPDEVGGVAESDQDKVLSLKVCAKLDLNDYSRCLKPILGTDDSDDAFVDSLFENYFEREVGFSALEYSGLSSPSWSDFTKFKQTLGVDVSRKCFSNDDCKEFSQDSMCNLENNGQTYCTIPELNLTKLEFKLSVGKELVSLDCRDYGNKQAPFKNVVVVNPFAADPGLPKNGFGAVDQKLADLIGEDPALSSDFICNYNSYTYENKTGVQYTRYLPQNLSLENYPEMSKYASVPDEDGTLIARHEYFGQVGYCLDWLGSGDPFDGTDVCLNWYPIDAPQGGSSLVRYAKYPEAGVLQNPKLAYCQVALGGHSYSDGIQQLGDVPDPISWQLLKWFKPEVAEPVSLDSQTGKLEPAAQLAAWGGDLFNRAATLVSRASLSSWQKKGKVLLAREGGLSGPEDLNSTSADGFDDFDFGLEVDPDLNLNDLNGDPEANLEDDDQGLNLLDQKNFLEGFTIPADVLEKTNLIPLTDPSHVDNLEIDLEGNQYATTNFSKVCSVGADFGGSEDYCTFAEGELAYPEKYIFKKLISKVEVRVGAKGSSDYQTILVDPKEGAGFNLKETKDGFELEPISAYQDRLLSCLHGQLAINNVLTFSLHFSDSISDYDTSVKNSHLAWIDINNCQGGDYEVEVFLQMHPFCQEVIKPIIDEGDKVFKYIYAKSFKDSNFYIDLAPSLELSYLPQTPNGFFGATTDFKKDYLVFGDQLGTPFKCKPDCLNSTIGGVEYPTFKLGETPPSKARADQLMVAYETYQSHDSLPEYQLKATDSPDIFSYSVEDSDYLVDKNPDFQLECPQIAALDDTLDEPLANQLGDKKHQFYCQDSSGNQNYGRFNLDGLTTGIIWGIGYRTVNFSFYMANQSAEQLPLREIEFEFSKGPEVASSCSSFNGCDIDEHDMVPIKGYFKNHWPDCGESLGDQCSEQLLIHTKNYNYDENVEQSTSYSYGHEELDVKYNIYKPAVRVHDNWDIYKTAIFGLTDNFEPDEICDSVVVFEPETKIEVAKEFIRELQLTCAQKQSVEDDLSSVKYAPRSEPLRGPKITTPPVKQESVIYPPVGKFYLEAELSVSNQGTFNFNFNIIDEAGVIAPQFFGDFYIWKVTYPDQVAQGSYSSGSNSSTGRGSFEVKTLFELFKEPRYIDLTLTEPLDIEPSTYRLTVIPETGFYRLTLIPR